MQKCHFEFLKTLSEISQELITNFKGDDIKELRQKVKVLAEIEKIANEKYNRPS